MWESKVKLQESIWRIEIRNESYEYSNYAIEKHYWWFAKITWEDLIVRGCKREGKRRNEGFVWELEHQNKWVESRNRKYHTVFRDRKNSNETINLN